MKIEDMRDVVRDSFMTEDAKKNEKWIRKVRKMRDGQVVAIYLRLQEQEKKRQRRKEWEAIPIYEPIDYCRPSA
jgi:hypothetical protein